MLFHVYLTLSYNSSLNFCHGPPELKHDYLRLLLWNIVFRAFKSVVSQGIQRHLETRGAR